MNNETGLRGESVFVYRKGALGDTVFYIPFLFFLRKYYSKIYFAGNYLYRHLFIGIDFIKFLDADSHYVFNLLRGKEDLKKFERFYIFSNCFDKVSENFYIFNPISISQQEWAFSYPFSITGEKFEPPSTYLPIFYNQRLAEDIKDKKFFVFHPGSGGAGKIWHVDNFFQLEEYLNQQDMEVYYLLGESENNILKSFSVKKILYNYSLNDIIFLLQYAFGFVGADTGIGHLAALIGVPGIMLFGPSNEKIYKPYGTMKAIKISENVNDIKPEYIIQILGDIIEKG